MLSFFLRGALIGLIFGVPVGAVGAMTAQRTLSHGRSAGFITGLGASAADCVYAVISAFGVTVISDIILKYQAPINLTGGAFILFLGLRMLILSNSAKVRRELETPSERQKTANESVNAVGYGKMFLSSFTVGITNPAAILSFLFAFSWFGIESGGDAGNAIFLVLGVFAGTYTWWTALTLAAFKFKEKAALHGMSRLNIIFGIALILFSAVIFIKLILKL